MTSANQWCRTCKQDKPKTSFYQCHRTKCMDCKREEKRMRLKNTAKDFCHTCNEWKFHTAFGVNARGDERLKTCVGCTKKKQDRVRSTVLDINFTAAPKKITVPETRWYLHTGMIALFIVGPGEFAMHRCSENVYEGRIGTAEERSIAKIAIKMLNDNIRNNLDAGPEAIQEALATAKSKYQTT